MPIIATSTLRIGYAEAGTACAANGTILFLHASGASRAQWKAYLAALGSSHACIAPDLIGYGETTDLKGRAFRAAHEVEIVEALTQSCGGGVHLVGHSYGGTVALNFALAHRPRVASLTLIEPVAFNLLHEARDAAWSEIEALARRHIVLVEAGDLPAAADAFMGYWIGAPRFAAMPEPQRQAIIGTMGKVADEWRSLLAATHPFAASAELRRLRTLGVPTLLMRGTATRAPVHRVVELLHRSIPGAHLTEIEGAGHMAPLTHTPAIIETLQLRLQRSTAAA
jgi:pimeloyl-ACP methyl ester carboxylesterase